MSQNPTIAELLHQAQAKNVPVPPNLKGFNTRQLSSGFFRGIIYGETDAWKTCTAVTLSDPEHTRIIVTRRPEQLFPLRDQGFDAIYAPDYARLTFALSYPEKIPGWEKWAELEEPVLVVDDLTWGQDIVLDQNQTDDSGREFRNPQLMYRGARADMKDIFVGITLRKHIHFVGVALARIYENATAREERIKPDFSPSIFSLIGTDIEYCFYADKQKRQLLTTEKTVRFQKRGPDDKPVRDEAGNIIGYTRITFAKNKLPLSAAKLPEAQRPIKEYEPMDLKSIWTRIKNYGTAPVVEKK